MGLVKDSPAPDAESSENSEASELMAEADEPMVPAHHAPKDMFAWRPQSSAADLLPGTADTPAEPASTAPDASGGDDQGLSSWLGTSSVLSKATAPAPSPAPSASDAISLWHPETAMIATDPGNSDSPEPAETPAAAPAPKAAVPRAPRLAQTSSVLNQFMSDLDF